MRQTEAWGTLAAAMQPFDAPGRLRVADNGDGAAIRRLTAAVLAEYGLVDDDIGDLDDIETAYVADSGNRCQSSLSQVEFALALLPLADCRTGDTNQGGEVSL